jgi:hypothetical protein
LAYSVLLHVRRTRASLVVYGLVVDLLSKRKATMLTIAAAQNFVTANRKQGCTCPCCGQYVKEYGRSIHTSMALMLIALYKRFESDDALEWLHVSRFPQMSFNINGDYNYLRHWGS